MEKNYFTKKTVYSDEPLKEIIYEIEDIPTMDVCENGDDPISRVVVKLLLRRHARTVVEYQKRLLAQVIYPVDR